MNIALLGYGKMGKMIEDCIISTGVDKVVLKINSANRSVVKVEELKKADVVIEFTNPGSVLDNIQWCLNAEIPIVVGTTGWYDHLEEVKKWCSGKNGGLVYSSNFSIGVNIFFELNRKLAELMKTRPEYEPSLTEIHHSQKKDAPSGTAITLANDLLKTSLSKKSWVNLSGSNAELKSDNPSEMIILSRREEAIVGTHTVEYLSTTDKIQIKHEAFSRMGFANGALAAAAWIWNNKGVYEFRDVIQGI
ncbi:MAG: 4-hydroxy-tetrahydrodipicolinate reductase [Chitinophagales bacterium]